MTPKEKAKELYLKMLKYQDNSDLYIKTNIICRTAKDCAQESVYEILNIDNTKPYILHKEINEFYQEVKKELYKL